MSPQRGGLNLKPCMGHRGREGLVWNTLPQNRHFITLRSAHIWQYIKITWEMYAELEVQQKNLCSKQWLVFCYAQAQSLNFNKLVIFKHPKEGSSLFILACQLPFPAFSLFHKQSAGVTAGGSHQQSLYVSFVSLPFSIRAKDNTGTQNASSSLL